MSLESGSLLVIGVNRIRLGYLPSGALMLGLLANTKKPDISKNAGLLSVVLLKVERIVSLPNIRECLLDAYGAWSKLLAQSA
jgi:hypothetical protein